MATLPKTQKYFYTVEEYLEIDRESGQRFEYVDGEIHQMAGESGAHGDISMNLAIAMGPQLKARKCRVRSKDTKIQSGSVSKSGQLMKGMFSYPDIVVICGEPEYHDKVKDIVLNPKVIIEVLSGSTESFDRNEKFVRYRMFNPTLTDYILISQTEPIVEHFIRQDNGTWNLRTFVGLEKEFMIDSIECQLKLADIYDLIEFPDDVLESLKENIYF